MTENVRVRVSKWDMPDKSYLSGGRQLENDKLGKEGNSHVEMPRTGVSWYSHTDEQVSTFDNLQGAIACSRTSKSDVQPEAVMPKTSSELSNYQKASESEMVKEEVIPWGPNPGSNNELEGGSDGKVNSMGFDVDPGDRDKSLWISMEKKMDDRDENHERKNSSWGNWPDDAGGNMSDRLGNDGWQQGIQSISPRKESRSYRSRSRTRSPSRSRSRSPAPGFRRDLTWKDRSKAGFASSHEPCRAFKAGRCPRGSVCRFLHEEGGRVHSVWPNRSDATDDKERYDKGRSVTHHNRETIGAVVHSEDKFSHGKRNRHDDGREGHNDYQNKRSTSQCINYSLGKCYKGSGCRYVHHDGPNDGRWHAKGGERDKGWGHDRSQVNIHPGHGHRNEANRTSQSLCKFYPEGRCRYGDHCNYLHEGPVKSPVRRPDWDKPAPHRGDNDRPMWNGPTWGDHVASDVQRSNAIGWGGDKIHAVASLPSAPNLSSTPSLPSQFPDARFSSLSNETTEIPLPAQGQNTVTEISSQHQWYDLSSHSHSVEVTHIPQSIVLNPENLPPENASRVITNSSSNEVNVPLSSQQGTDSFRRKIPDQTEPEVSQALNIQVKQAGWSQEIVPKNSIVCNTQSQYIDTAAPPNAHDLGVPQYPAFGGHDHNIYSQPPTGLNQFPVMQPPANVHSSSAEDHNCQLKSQPGSAVETSRENLSLHSDMEKTEPIDGVSLENKNVVTNEQMVQLTHISASLAQIFGNNQQLPQLYAALNPSAPEVTPMQQPFSQSNSGMPAPSAALALQPNTNMWSQQYQKSLPSNIVSTDLSSQISSNYIEQTMNEGAPMTSMNLPPVVFNNAGGQGGSTISEWKINEDKKFDTSGQNGSGKLNEIPKDQSKKELLTALKQDVVSDAEHRADKKDTDKDAKGIRLFKYTLVELVKEMLKPTWKEGNMSKEAHKTIVKKVVDKVTGALQSNIPQTQERIDFYIEHSKGKLSKLVEAYIEKYAKP